MFIRNSRYLKEVLTYISCMDTAYVRETPPPKEPEIRFVQETLHFRYLKVLVKCR